MIDGYATFLVTGVKSLSDFGDLGFVVPDEPAEFCYISIDGPVAEDVVGSVACSVCDRFP
jgi:hypothetical protein